MKFLIKLVREILHLSGKIQGKFGECQRFLTFPEFSLNFPDKCKIFLTSLIKQMDRTCWTIQTPSDESLVYSVNLPWPKIPRRRPSGENVAWYKSDKV